VAAVVVIPLACLVVGGVWLLTIVDIGYLGAAIVMSSGRPGGQRPGRAA
jgi:hypothetical protein